MLFEIVICFIAGIIIGSLTGLAPGIHINLVGAGLLALVASGKLNFFPPIALVVFVVALAITHTLIDFIPSIFLGAPNEETYLTVLPGHKLLKEGRGYEAVVLTFYGGLVALPIVLIVSFLFFYFLNGVFAFETIFIPYVLIFLSLYLIFREKEFLISLTIFICSGLLGLLAFHLPVQEPLLPLLSGLFGISGLLVSMKEKVKIPEQRFQKLRMIRIEKKSFIRAIFSSGVSAAFFSFLPAVGSGYAAIFGSEAMGKDGEDGRVFLFLVGAISVIAMALSFVIAFILGKPRTGAAAAVQQILTNITTNDVMIIILVFLISAVFSFLIGLFLARIFAGVVHRVNYAMLSVIVMGIILIVNLFLSNWEGWIVLVTASALGVFAILSGTRRINLIGCLLVPSIVYALIR